MRYLLVGNYGVGNLGDDLIREYFLRAFPDVEWQSVGVDVPRFPCGLQSIFRPWWRTWRALRQSDGMVFGGGTLFTDTEALFACVLWWWHATLARLAGRPVFLAFQGIGPFRTWMGEALARSVVKRAAFVSVRDPESAKRIGSWTLSKNTKVVQTFDPVISLFQATQPTDSAKIVIIIPRANSTGDFLTEVEKTCQSGQWSAARILLLEPEADGPAATMVVAACGTVKADVVPVRSLTEFQQALSGAGFVLTQRFHGAVPALGLGIPFATVPLASGDKLDAIRSAKREECVGLVEAGREALDEALRRYSRTNM